MQSNENKEILLEDAIKCNTTKTLTKFMRSSQEYYNDAIEFFSNAKSVELLRENFSVLINDQKFNIAYKFIYLKAILKAVGNSMKELIIVECPCPCCLDSVLYHIIRGEKGPDPDDTLDEKFVDSSGAFSLNGYTRELTNIDPVLYVWHDCNDQETPCQRKVKFIIPQKFIISDAPKDDQWVDFGTINLESTFAEEKRECIH
uniref:Uncharacterized protein n=1 Tax=Panagrolaimus sp. PS1159 TaxID=55785 RepID=A0AC35FZE4_9BILA